MVPGYTFVHMKGYRNRVWDGKIRLFNVHNRLLYGGLLEHLCKFLYTRNFKVKFESDFKHENVELTEEYIKSLRLPVQPRDYQLDTKNRPL